MKYFGTTDSNKDLVDKSYVDSFISGVGYNSVSTVDNLPIDKKNIIVTLPNNVGYTLSLSSDLSIGQELFIYAKTTNQNGSMIVIPITLNNHPVSYNGTYDSTSVGTQTIQLSYSTLDKNVSRTTATLHIFFDGSIYYIDLLSAITTT